MISKISHSLVRLAHLKTNAKVFLNKNILIPSSTYSSHKQNLSFKINPSRSQISLQISYKMAKQSKKQKDKMKHDIQKKKVKQQIGDTSEFDLNVYQSEYQEVVDEFQNTLSTYKIGRLDQSYFTNIYAKIGSKSQSINKLGQIAPKSANVVVLNPYDTDHFEAIQKSLQASDFGFQITKVQKTLIITQPPNTMNQLKKKMQERLKKQTQSKKQKLNDIRTKVREQIKKYQKVTMQDRIKQIQTEAKNLNAKFLQKIEKLSQDKEKQLGK